MTDTASIQATCKFTGPWGVSKPTAKPTGTCCLKSLQYAHKELTENTH